MPGVHMNPKARTALLLFLLWLLVTLPMFWFAFARSERVVVLGAHAAKVSPSFDNHATLDFGPVLPRMRIPTDQPLGLGVSIDVGETDASDVNELIARDAVIASQPDGEILRVQSAVTGMAIDAGLRAGGAGLVAVLLVLGVGAATGPERRAAIWQSVRHPQRPDRRGALVGSAVGVAAVVAVGLIVIPQDSETGSLVASEGWVPINDVIDGLRPDEYLDQVELARGSATDGGVALIEGALDTYQTSVTFYGDMRDRVPDVEEDIRKPEEDEKVALLLSDRHDNIGIDPVVADLARAAEAKLIIDAGDDTSTGGEWESFSIDSMEKAYADFSVVAIAGNHDTGEFVANALDDAGFTVLDGEPKEVEGITFLGESDPRSSGLTAGYSEDSGSIEDQGEVLAEVACEDEDVSTLVVHSPTTGEPVADSGCVDLVVSGHMHRQIGPDQVEGEEGTTTTYTNGTTGGAAYAFALGSKLRRPAQVSLVTYRDDRPVGIQPIDLQTDGQIHVADYIEIPREEDDDEGDAKGDGKQDQDSAGDRSEDRRP